MSRGYTPHRGDVTLESAARTYRGCIDKRAYPSKHRALGARRRMIQQQAERAGSLEAYKCKRCHRWHLGHSGRGHRLDFLTRTL